MKVSPTTRLSIFIQMFSIFLVFGVSLVLASGFKTNYSKPQMRGLNGWEVTSLFTIGETLPSSETPRGYTPVGSMDGIGAATYDAQTIRVYVNHELPKNLGYGYTLGNGTQLKGARVSFLDIDRNSRKIVDSGLAYRMIFDRQFKNVTDPGQINEVEEGYDGLNKLCSAHLVGKGQYNFEDQIFFTHEEAEDPLVHPHGGSLWALDTQRMALHAIPAGGRHAWENTSPVEAPKGQVALLIGEDTDLAPLWLYIGRKNASVVEIKQTLPSNVSPPHQTFLNRNGLLVGDLYFFVSNQEFSNPSNFHGTGNRMDGTWKKIEIIDKTKAGQPGYDRFGYKNGKTLRKEAFLGGAFQFSRPEDLSTNPNNPNQVVLTATGRGTFFQGADDWGTTYIINVRVLDMLATVKILYDGDDSQNKQNSVSDFGIRSPDNVEWAKDGFIYIQEDPATQINRFGGVSGREASVWRVNPETGKILRIAEMYRSVIVPQGVTDLNPLKIGVWESSGILDVTTFFQSPTHKIHKSGNKPKRIFLGNVQAHSLRDGIILERHLGQGGQLIFLEHTAE